jgi:hypothetical protein
MDGLTDDILKRWMYALIFSAVASSGCDEA